jgi:hypothetical protein
MGKDQVMGFQCLPVFVQSIRNRDSAYPII